MLVSYTLLLALWARCDYVGSFEWIIARAMSGCAGHTSGKAAALKEAGWTNAAEDATQAKGDGAPLEDAEAPGAATPVALVGPETACAQWCCCCCCCWKCGRTPVVRDGATELAGARAVA